MLALSKRFRRNLGASTALTLAGIVWSTGLAQAAVYFASTADELAAAINTANANPGNDVITLTGNINLNTLTAATDGQKFLPHIGNTDGSSGGLAIDLGGNTISGNDTTRVFFANKGDLTISNGTIADGLAQGGHGGYGDDGAGGGGMGAGGALYVRAGANVTVDGVSFTDNQAKGGNSGAPGPADYVAGGGGGGLGGNGGAGTSQNLSGGSGGGGGAFANGQSGDNGSAAFIGAAGGGPNGGAGTGGSVTAGNGGDLSGGGGSGGAATGPAPASGGIGGAGGYGGGGGGTSSKNAGAGAGGFGGGGGGAGNFNSPGGAGGFGGGGGGGYQGSGTGGFGGGNGGTSDNAGGGGGAGFGGAIFIQDGGSLSIAGSGTISGGGVTGGTGGHNAGSGMARGTGIFLQNAGLTFAPGEGQTQTVSDIIADDTGNGGSAGKLTKDGAGTLILSGVNTYSGGTTIKAGVLEIEADNNLGAAGVGITIVDGTLSASASFTSARDIELTGAAGIGAAGELELTGIISGAGSLTKRGAGTVILSSANTYEGGTTIAEGILEIDADDKLGAATGGLTIGDATLRATAGFTSARTVELTGEAKIEAQADELELTGVVSGEGSLTKTGTGTLILSGINTYEGGTTIAEGILEVGADNNLGSTTGGLTIDDATLRASAGFTSARAVELTGDAGIEIEAGDLILNGEITGEGSLTKTGAGTLQLFGSNDYSGGTTLEEGTLIGDAAGLQGAILNDAKLIFDQDTEATYAGVLTGTGSTTKEGLGALIFSGDSSAYDGETHVDEGTLRVNGKLGGSIDVASGAKLGGNGTLGKTTIAAGGIHAPGNSIDTQTVAGDYTNNGTLEIEVSPSAADKVVVNGGVDITGAILALNFSPATPLSWGLFTGPYVIIQNDGADAVEGSFTDITRNLIFLDPTVSYVGGDGNDVTLELARNQTGFADVGKTGNQAATGDAIETLNNTSAVWRTLALSSTEEEAQALLDQLSGEIHASLAGMFNQDSRFWRNAANDRLRASFDGVAAPGQQVMGFSAAGLADAPADSKGLVLWQQSYGAWAKTGGDDNTAEFKRTAGGFVAGADMLFGDSVRLGALGGYAHSSFDDDRNSSGDADSYQIGLYGGALAGPVALRAGVAYAWHDIDTERAVMGDKLKADYDAGTVQVFGEAGYAIDLDAVRLEPFANAAYVATRTDGFEENGGPAALKSDAETTKDTFTTLGLRATIGFDAGEIPASFRAMAGWRHAYGDVNPEATFTLDGSEEFVILGAPIARDAAVLEAGFDLSLTADATLGLAYSGEIGNDAENHGFNAALAVKF